MPRISVVMPVYNSAKFLVDALESISNQTFTDFEIIAINDGSTDKSLELLQNYAKKEHRLRIVSRENKGVTKTLNEGIDLATGEYIARMDADDISLPLRFERQLKYLVNNNLDVCGTQYERFGTKTGFSNMPINIEDCYYRLLLGSTMAHPSILIKKYVIAKYKYNDNIKYAQDYELWCRMALDKRKIGNVPEVLLKYRYSSNNISSSKSIDQINSAITTGTKYWVNIDISKGVPYPLCVIDSFNNNISDLKNSIMSLIILKNRLNKNIYMSNILNSELLLLLGRLSVYGLNNILPFLKHIPNLNNKSKIICSLLALTRVMRIKDKLNNIIPSSIKAKICNYFYSL